MKKTKLKRKTRETDIQVEINLDGTGVANLKIPEKWLAHMLSSVARFGGFDIKVAARGDFSHHIVEDIAITLGKAFRVAIEGRNVQRVGSATVAMDDALVMVCVDLVDRPYCDVTLPDEMLVHFLRSFAMESRITLHNLVHRGRNFHHINEATFKALGMALRDATRVSGSLVSTKGKVRWKK